MLNQTDKSDIRRHLKYPALNRGNPGQPFFARELWSLDQHSTFLEQRMDLMMPTDEARLTGKIVGAIGFVGAEPIDGATYSVTFTSLTLLPLGPVTIGPITAGPKDTKLTMAAKLPQLIALNNILASAQMTAGGPFGPGLGQLTIEKPEVEFMAPKEFTITLTFAGMAIFVDQQGIHVDPQVNFGGESCGFGLNELDVDTTTYGYLPILNALENAIGGSSSRAHISKAEGFVKSDEFRERTKLYDLYRAKLANFLGVPFGPMGAYNNSFIL